MLYWPKKSLVMPFYYINFDQNGPPYFLLSNPMILEAFPKHFLSMGEEEAKNKRQDCCVTPKPKN